MPDPSSTGRITALLDEAHGGRSDALQELMAVVFRSC